MHWKKVKQLTNFLHNYQSIQRISNQPLIVFRNGDSYKCVDHVMNIKVWDKKHLIPTKISRQKFVTGFHNISQKKFITFSWQFKQVLSGCKLACKQSVLVGSKLQCAFRLLSSEVDCFCFLHLSLCQLNGLDRFPGLVVIEFKSGFPSDSDFLITIAVLIDLGPSETLTS